MILLTLLIYAFFVFILYAFAVSVRDIFFSDDDSWDDDFYDVPK